MEITEFRKIKSGNAKQLETLYDRDLRTAWFICYHVTLEKETAVPLLHHIWNHTINRLCQMSSPPQESFLQLFCKVLLNEYAKPLSADDNFSRAEIPAISRKFAPFLEQMDKLPSNQRVLYLVSNFGGLSQPQIAEVIGKTPDEVKEILQEASAAVLRISQKKYHISGTEVITLSAEFRKSDNSALANIKVSDIVADSLRHDAQKKFPETAVQATKAKRKDITMKAKQKSKKKIIGWSIFGVLLIAAIIALILILPKLKQASAASDIVTSYTAEEITYGDVNSTISGSGTLSPLNTEVVAMPSHTTTTEEESASIGDPTSASNQTATVASDTSDIVSIAVAAGDTVAEGDVIAVIQYEDETEENVTAGIAGVVIEVPVSAGDSVEAGGEIAMIMGEDGFSLSLSVDELDIADVAIGQDVTITVDAVSGEYTGTVAAVSYNGTTSGSATSYQIQATMEYEEGIYPGMSAAAEIVTESSGEGLLVPVEAVRTSGDDSYVYLAPDGAESGSTYSEDELDISDLTKVTVDTDMSDGSYIMVVSDELAEGDLVIVTTTTSSATGSDSTDSQNGGFGGGGFGGGDFSGGDFDPSNMPQGGGMPMGNGE